MNKISIITGGSSGLGFEIARLLCEKEHNICLVSGTASKLDVAVDKLKTGSKTSTILTFQANIGKETKVSQLFEFLSNRDFEPDFVFNAAGIGLFGSPDAATEAMISKVFEANLIGTILISTYALRAMKTNGGTVVNIMSTAAQTGNALESIYCAAKWGARGYTEALQAATKGTPIKVIAVYPGGMNTPFWTEGCGLSPDTSKFMHPADVAKLIIEAVTNANSAGVFEMIIQRNL